jgi:glutamate carboxypeptidase
MNDPATLSRRTEQGLDEHGPLGPISPQTIQSLREAIESRLGRTLEMLHEMVSINSFTRNVEGVGAVAELTALHFSALGFEAEHLESAEQHFGDHLVLTRHGLGNLSIGLVSHLDTVYTAEEEALNHFHWQVEGDRIYGPGTIDIKGGTAMIWLVLDTLREAAPEAFEQVTWRVMLNSAEEELAQDFSALLRHRLRGAAACLVFEASQRKEQGWGVVTRRKGMATFDIEVFGRSAHAGSAHDRGASALLQMARVIERVAAISDPERELSANVGVVSGGTVVNRIPHHAKAKLELRAYDPEVLEDAVARVFEIAREEDVVSADGAFRCRIVAHQSQRVSAWPDNEGSKGLFAIWREAGQAAGETVVAESRGGLSDGNKAWPVVPTIDGLGPSGDNMHASERDPEHGKEPEYVEPASYLPRALVNATAILRLIEYSRAGKLPHDKTPEGGVGR